MSIKAVIGKNFGDEGKGLATDYLAMLSKRAGHSCIVVRHNGGAQAGHTVEASGKRFIFREISSGTLRGADCIGRFCCLCSPGMLGYTFRVPYLGSPRCTHQW